MNAILLCAGYGTRLLPLTKSTPKALLPVADRPVLDYLIEQLLELPELKSIHLVSNAASMSQFYLWEMRWQERLAARGIAMHLYNDGSLSEEKRLGSVGALAFVLRSLGDTGPAIVTAGDAIYRFPLQPLVTRFLEKGENLVPAFPERSWQVRQRFPILQLADDDRVLRVVDQPEQPTSEWLCPRLYFVQPRVFSYVDPYLRMDGTHPDSLAIFMDHLVQKEEVYAVRMPDARMWLDLGTRYMYDKANEILNREPPILEQA